MKNIKLSKESRVFLLPRHAEKVSVSGSSEHKCNAERQLSQHKSSSLRRQKRQNRTPPSPWQRVTSESDVGCYGNEHAANDCRQPHREPVDGGARRTERTARSTRIMNIAI